MRRIMNIEELERLKNVLSEAGNEGQESPNPYSYTTQELLDNQARARLEARARGLKFLSFTEEKAKEEQEKLFDAQVKWAFNKAVDYIRATGLREDVAKTISSMLIRELDKLPNCCVTSVRVNTDPGGIVSLIVEGINEGNRISKTLSFNNLIFDPLPAIPSDFNPLPEKTTIDEDLINFLIK